MTYTNPSTAVITEIARTVAHNYLNNCLYETAIDEAIAEAGHNRDDLTAGALAQLRRVAAAYIAGYRAAELAAAPEGWAHT